MQTQNSAIQEIDANIREAQKYVELGNTLERLRENRDFKSIVLEGYFEKEAIRLVHLKADPSMQTPERQASILTQIDAIGAVRQYFDSVLHRANMAAKQIESDEMTREEILAEGSE